MGAFNWLYTENECVCCTIAYYHLRAFTANQLITNIYDFPSVGRLQLARNRKQRMPVAHRHFQAFTTNLLTTDINLEFSEVCKVVEVKLYYLFKGEEVHLLNMIKIYSFLLPPLPSIGQILKIP